MDATTLALIGLVLTVAVPLLVFALERQTTRNLWNRITGKGPISTAVTSGPIDYARRYIGLPEYVIPRTIDQIPIPPSQMEYVEERQKWADALDGIDARWTSVEVTVTGRSSEPVILHELRVEVLEREPPLEGAHITYGPLGEGAFLRWLSVDLDRVPPEVTQSIDQRYLVEEGIENPVRFPYRVSDTQPETFFILATTEHHDCRWRAVLIWSAGGKRGSTVIDNDGQPFRTTAPSRATTYASYDGKTFLQE